MLVRAHQTTVSEHRMSERASERGPCRAVLVALQRASELTHLPLTLSLSLCCSFLSCFLCSPPAADVDSVDPALVELASVRAQVADLSARIQQWHAAFKERTGRKPSSTDMMADEALAAMLKQLAPSKRRVAALEKMTAPAAAVNP